MHFTQLNLDTRVAGCDMKLWQFKSNKAVQQRRLRHQESSMVKPSVGSLRPGHLEQGLNSLHLLQECKQTEGQHNTPGYKGRIFQTVQIKFNLFCSS